MYLTSLTGFNLHFHTNSEFAAVCSRSLTFFVSSPRKGAGKLVFLLFSVSICGRRLGPAYLAQKDFWKRSMRRLTLKHIWKPVLKRGSLVSLREERWNRRGNPSLKTVDTWQVLLWMGWCQIQPLATFIDNPLKSMWSCARNDSQSLILMQLQTFALPGST